MLVMDITSVEEQLQAMAAVLCHLWAGDKRQIVSRLFFGGHMLA